MRVAAVVALLVTTALSAQSLVFEVASIRPLAAVTGPQAVAVLPGGRVTANVPLRLLIRIAYGLDENQLVGAPSWIDTARFDIAAAAGREVTREEALAMLRALLEDRFALKSHRETRELPVYDLVLARPDGRWGSSLRRSESACAGIKLPMLSPGMPVPPPPPPPVGPQALALGVGSPLRCPSMFIQGWISAREVTLEVLATRLLSLAGRPVVNRTGLTGFFDIDLAYTPDATFGAPAPFAPADGPSLFTAMQEQLGLRLAAARGPVDVLVVDSVQAPTAN
jgi:uncharacterized protein (TIGR03435 family)